MCEQLVVRDCGLTRSRPMRLRNNLGAAAAAAVKGGVSRRAARANP